MNYHSSYQFIVPDILQKLTTSNTLVLTLSFLEVTADIAVFHFFKMHGTHHEKAGSLSKPLDAENPTTSTGLHSLRSLSGVQVLAPSFYVTLSLPPLQTYGTVFYYF